MTDQRTVLNLLRENPVTETASWIAGEPSVQDILGDPVIHAVLRRDGLSMHDLMCAIARGRHRLSPAKPAASRLPGPGVSLPGAAVGGSACPPPANDAAA